MRFVYIEILKRMKCDTSASPLFQLKKSFKSHWETKCHFGPERPFRGAKFDGSLRHLGAYLEVCAHAYVSLRPWYFSSGATVPQKKYLGPKQSPPVSFNDLKKDGAQFIVLLIVLIVPLSAHPPYFEVVQLWVG